MKRVSNQQDVDGNLVGLLQNPLSEFGVNLSAMADAYVRVAFDSKIVSVFASLSSRLEGVKKLRRDVKSSNIMLDSKFESKLGDFELARTIRRTEQTHGWTREIAGTRGFMGPEIFLTSRATFETDVYAFGVTVVEVA
uniref:Protein kinase domain-containing protein n=1 Tax=Cucumis melo TaxID=3656 RepID=A0A1S4DVB4_CUCME